MIKCGSYRNFNDGWEPLTKEESNFISNPETLDAMEEAEAIASGKIETRSYKTFNDMWSDICETKNS